MFRHLRASILLLTCLVGVAHAQDADAPIQSVLQSQADLIVKSSRKTIQPAIDAITTSGLPQTQAVLQAWTAKEIWQRKADGLFFRGVKIDAKTYELFDIPIPP